MFGLLYIILLIGAGALFFKGIKNKRSAEIWGGLLLFLLVFLFFRFLNFWGEKLWFDALGYTDRFWVLAVARWGFALGGLLLGALLVWLLLIGLPRDLRWLRYMAALLGGLYATLWGLGNWPELLLFIEQVPTTLTDPIFNLPTGFYLFSLPFYQAVLNLLLALTVIALITALLAVFVDPALWSRLGKFRNWGNISWNQDALAGFVDPAAYRPLFTATGFFLILLAVSKYLDRYQLLYSSNGVAFGPGWTDVHVRLPMMWLVLVAAALLGLILLIPPLQKGFRYWLTGRLRWISGPVGFLLSSIAMLALLWFVALGVVPGVFQSVKVNPNEITLEKPYIINNIKFTREGFNLNKIVERQYPVIDRFSRETVLENKGIFANIRLWDYRALDQVYKQFQEFRLYYEFEDIDIDRYRYNGQYNQVMISAREMDVNNLPVQSQTFVNRKFKYTHGFGVVMNNVSEFTTGGLPEFLVKNIPPVSRYPELTVLEPRIYYGEEPDEYVVANSSEQEFDFPQGDDNVYIHYEGKGGVKLENFWRKFLFAYKFNEPKLLFSGYPRPQSRIMFNRNIRERVQKLAPFLQYDNDPYIVLAEGRLFWMIDAYTTSDNFPYSQPYASVESDLMRYEGTQGGALANRNIRGINYIRNSVKAVVDAYNGQVSFYVFDPEDPLIQTWNRVVPGLLKPWQEMPESLLAHIRYPADLLLVQGVVYAKYHMLDPTVFYNQEDLWVRATEKYLDQVQPVEPYYIMWELPEEDELTFVLMMPFTPKNRQVLVGWLAGLCDPEHYGELLAYNFPKDELVIGPQQVETKIDQDPNLSSQLTLWDQRGSSVIRGNVLAIPVNETLFYVEPIYLQAETAAYPELRVVVVMQNERMAYAPTFEEALQKLLAITEPGIALSPRTEVEPRLAGDTLALPPSAALNERIRAANQAFEEYLRFTGDRDYKGASEALQRLEENLRALDAERNRQ